MRVELICIGSELLCGKINTDLSYLGERLSSMGLDISLASTIGDTKHELVKIFHEAIKRSDIVISTGGLGPTFDDLTRQAVSDVIDKPLVLKRDILSSIARYFLTKDLEMPKNNESQAYILQGAKPVLNKVGVAPGQIIEIDTEEKFGKKGKVAIILLPGPPRELQNMFEGEVLSYLKRFERKIKKSAVLHTCGLLESKVDEKIREIVEVERKLDKGLVDFTILAHQSIVDVKVSVSGENEMLVDEMLSNIKNELYEVLGDSVYAEGKKTLESSVGELLIKMRKTLSIAESCTGGLVSGRVTNIPGSSLYFKGSVVSYSNESKMKILGVSNSTIEKYGAVSKETAIEMAKGIKSMTGSDFAVSVTGIAGPSGGTPEKPVGLVYGCINTPFSNTVYKINLRGNRLEIRERAANQILNFLRLKIVSELSGAAETKNKKSKRK